MMTDIIAIIVLFLIAAGALLYIYKAKKSGAACIGCPHAGKCAKSHGSHSQCGCHGDHGSCSCCSDDKETK